MNKNKIKMNPVDYLDTTRNSLSTDKPVLEFIDNSMQYANGKNITVVFNQKQDSIWIIDDGCGFHDLSFQKFHQPFGKPVNSDGMSMFGVGSKSFIAIANKRSVYSKGKDREYSSHWNYAKEPESWIENYSDNNINVAKDILKNCETGTVVILEDLSEQKSFGNFYDFFENIVEISKKRYGRKLSVNDTRLKFKLISTSSESESIEIEKADVMKNEKDVEISFVDDVEIRSYLSSESRGVSQQGIDVYYDDFLLETIPWKANGSKKRFVNKPAHNTFNFIRQEVFLKPNPKRVVAKIDPYKSKVELEECITEVIVNDFMKIRSKVTKGKSKETEKELTKNKTVKVNVSDVNEKFDKHPNSPFKFDDDGVTYNKDSYFYNFLSTQKAENKKVIMTLLEQLELTRDNFQQDKGLIQSFLKHFSNNFETELKKLKK